MKKITLTKNRFALVDDDDFEWLNNFHWFFSDNGYAKRNQYVRLGVNKYTSKPVWMHRLVNKTPDGFITDHINQDKLDNRKNNLRTVNKSINGFNRNKPKNNSSGVKGVYWENYTKKWRAEIKINCRKICLGRYRDIFEAVKARRKGEEIYHAV